MPRYEIQTFYLTPTSDSGTYLPSVGGTPGSAIQHDGDASAIKDGIEAAVGIGKIAAVTGSGSSGSPWRVKYECSLGDQAQMTIDTNTALRSSTGPSFQDFVGGNPGDTNTTWDVTILAGESVCVSIDFVEAVIPYESDASSANAILVAAFGAAVQTGSTTASGGVFHFEFDSMTVNSGNTHSATMVPQATIVTVSNGDASEESGVAQPVIGGGVVYVI